MTSPEFGKMNKLRGFQETDKDVKCIERGNSTEVNYEITLAFIVQEEISMRGKSTKAEVRLGM